jgi:3-carboxy-cis,cis-muconate cycloisomerase
MSLFDSLATTRALTDVFSDRALLGRMVQFEVALARVQGRLGLIPASAAEAIAAAADPDALDAAAIAAASVGTATMAIPFVEALRRRVRDAQPAAADHVHWGATSQDVVDTAVVLCLTSARAVLEADHRRVATGLARLADEHGGTVMLARTLLQPAPPTTFGLKAAGWLDAESRSWRRLAQAFDASRVLQFGGGSGTLAALGAHGIAVSSALASELGLDDPGAPWHSHRDRFATLVAACGVYTGVLGKIARDVSLLMQEEVGEAAERGGGSSTLPHKRNPSSCAIVLAAALRVPGLVAAFLAALPQEHERGVGTWHAECATLRDAVQTTGAALAATATIVETLTVDGDRMRQNLAATGGAIFAERAMVLLVPKIGRDAAAAAVADAIRAARTEGRTFGDALAANPTAAAALRPEDFSTLATPEAYLGSAEAFRRRLLSRPD